MTPVQRPPAPAAQDASDAWRAAMHAEAEAQSSLRQEETPEPAPADAWPISDLSEQRTSPFAEFNERPEQASPLQEWWAEPAPAAQPSASQAHASSQPAAAQEESPAPQFDEVDESLARAASRLGGLRNLLVTLGIQNLHQGAEQRKAELQAEHRLPERAVYAQPVGPGGSGDQNSAEVTARPEIIPPRALAEAVERHKDPRTPVKSPQVNRWDSPDDVEILPSRRGQYRRKH